jgi:hypothetical protein
VITRFAEQSQFYLVVKEHGECGPAVTLCPILKYAVFANPSLILDVVVSAGDRGDQFGDLPQLQINESGASSQSPGINLLACRRSDLLYKWPVFRIAGKRLCPDCSLGPK